MARIAAICRTSRPLPEAHRAEALSVLVLLRDRGQRRTGATTRVVLHEFCRERGGQRVDEAPLASIGGVEIVSRDLRAEDKNAVAMPNAGHQSVPVPFLHAAALAAVLKCQRRTDNVDIALATTHE